MSPVLSFFSGHPNTDRRTLSQILSFSDDELEFHHDVIQWCFPLHEPSPVNPDAPVVTPADHKILSTTPALQQAMRTCLARWLTFYGFAFADGRVTPAANFAAQSIRWNHRLNHNHLRITRIIRSLRLFGLDAEARATHDAFAAFAASPASHVNATTLAYWHAAFAGELFAPVRPR